MAWVRIVSSINLVDLFAMLRTRTSLALTAATLLLGACDSPSQPPGPPASIELAALDPRPPVVATSMPIRVQVRDANNNAVPGVTVRWRIYRLGGGSFRPAGEAVEPESSITDSKGMAETTILLGTRADRYTVNAVIEGVPYFSVDLHTVPAPPFLIWPDTAGARAPLPLPLRSSRRLFARDHFGNTIPATSVVWGSSDPAVAAVDPAGYIVANGVGTATITAKQGGTAAAIQIASVAPARFRSLEVGGGHACALDEGGRAYCWGSAGRFASTAFGTSLAPDLCVNFWTERHENVDITGPVSCFTRPVPVHSDLAFRSIVTRERGGCGITVEGTTYCWGEATGTGSPSPRPAPVTGEEAFIMLAAGDGHVCALTADGRTFCWGNAVQSSTPIAVAGSPAFTSISAGSNQTCGVTREGAAYCWRAHPDSVPARVSGDVRFTTLATGGGFSCGISDSGRAFCWGDNRTGALGNGTTANSPVPVEVTGGFTFTSISVSASHTCAVATSGEGYCWGDNRYHQLGSTPAPGTEIRLSPSAVAGGLRFKEIHAADDPVPYSAGEYTCGITLEDETYCWGTNISGQMGNRPRASFTTQEGRIAPQPLPAGVLPPGY